MKYVLIMVYSYLIQDDEYYPEGKEAKYAKMAIISDSPLGLSVLTKVKKYLRLCHGKYTWIDRSYETVKDERSVRKDFPETWTWEELSEVIDNSSQVKGV